MRNFKFTEILNYTDMFGPTYRPIPNDCEIIVKDDTEKELIKMYYESL